MTLVEQYAPGHGPLGLGRRHAPAAAAHGDVEWYTRARAARPHALARAAGVDRRPRSGSRSASPGSRGARTASRRRAARRSQRLGDRARVARARRRRAASIRRSASTTCTACSTSPTPACCTRGARRSCSSRTASGSACDSQPAPRLDPATQSDARRRRLGLRRVAAAALPRARRAGDLAARRLLPRRRTAAGAARPGFCDYDAPFYGHGDIGGLGVKIAPDVRERRDRPRLARAPAAPTSGGARRAPTPRRRFPSLADAPVIGARVCQYEPHRRHALPRRAASRTRRVVARRRRLGARLQARPGARRVRRRLRRGPPHAGAVPRARPRAPATPACARRPRRLTPRRRGRARRASKREHQLAQQPVQLLLLGLRQRRGEERLAARLDARRAGPTPRGPSGVSSTTTPRRSSGSGSRRTSPALLEPVEPARHRAASRARGRRRARRASCGSARAAAGASSSTCQSGCVRPCSASVASIARLIRRLMPPIRSTIPSTSRSIISAARLGGEPLQEAVDVVLRATGAAS